MLGLLYFLIIEPTTVKNMQIPMLDQRPIQSAYLTSKLPKSQKVSEFQNELNKIMYIPVAAVTAGCIPSPINIGLNTIPPPSPTELANPPPRDAIINWTRSLPLQLNSLLLYPFLVITFSWYSSYNLLIYKKLTTKQMNKNPKKKPKSPALHFCRFMMEGFLLEPLNRFTTKETKSNRKQSRCTLH